MAIKSNGTAGQYVDFSTTSLRNIGQITICAWANQSANTLGYLARYALANDTSPDWYFDWNDTANGDVDFIRRYNTTDGIWKATGAAPTLNTNYHICVSYDAGSLSNNPLIYVNAVSKTVTRTQAPAGTPLQAATDLFIIGRTLSSLTGWVEDLRIYNRILSITEITGLYNSGSPTSFETNDNGLVFQAPMLIGTGITPPWNGTTLVAGNKIIDRINCLQGTPNGSLAGQTDSVYNTGY